MGRNGLLVAGAIVGIVRGVLGLIIGSTALSAIELVDRTYPGAGALMLFEFLLALTSVVASIWILSRANRPTSAKAIKRWGVVLVIAGFIDGFALVAIFQSAATTAFGSILMSAVIGGLIIAGANRLALRLAPTAGQ